MDSGQARPGRGPVSSERWLSSPTIPTRTRTWAPCCKEQGKFDEAAARYEQALALRPDYAEAHYHRADLKTFRAGDPDLAALEALAADTRPSASRQDALHPLCARQGARRRRRLSPRLRALAPGQCSETPRSPLRRSGLSANFPAHCRACSTPACSIASAAWAIPRRSRSSSSACPVPAARSSSRFWPATRRSTPPAN